MPEQIKGFEAQDFERRAPGALLRDFETLLSLIGDQGMAVTPAHLFTMNCLETINRSLTHPLELRLKRAAQKSYPYINGLYLLLRATGISWIDTQPKKPLLKLDPIVLESWRSLNGAERYFALLKAWWGRASDEMLGESRGWQAHVLEKAIDFFERFPETGTLTIETPQDADSLRYYPGFYNLALMEGFGLLEVRVKPPAESRGWLPERIRMLDWGQVLLGSYARFIRQSLSAESGSANRGLGFMALFEPLERFERWSRAVRPAIKGWRADLKIPGSAFQPGRHVFKVSLGTACWRRIAIPGKDYLDELAQTILDAFDFDSDHLYHFSYKDRFGCTIEIDHPYLAGHSDNALTDAVKVGEIPLTKGMRMAFLFDFGDQWEFVIETESVDAGPAITQPQVLEKHGEAPSQYGDW
nr:hypothetical protein [Gammaproteobacteria bacterium]